jgi:hypothetical protein
MALIGSGILRTARLPVQGQFWSVLAGPLFITGVGTAFAFIPVSIAALAGVREGDAGLASGLLNTTQNIGGAIGVAVAQPCRPRAQRRCCTVATPDRPH